VGKRLGKDTLKKKNILERIHSFEDAIRRANEYLESGEHASWLGFRPAFSDKTRDGNSVAPHKDWVRNVYLPRVERALNRAERLLERLDA
jgi:hypothetical protein